MIKSEIAELMKKASDSFLWLGCTIIVIFPPPFFLPLCNVPILQPQSCLYDPVFKMEIDTTKISGTESNGKKLDHNNISLEEAGCQASETVNK